jgi:hypothetical protein
MKRIIFILSALFLILMFIGCEKRPLELKCSIDIEILKENIKLITNADTVLIYTKRLKEEIYFPELRFPVIVIENATTQTLDFKTLPMDKYKDIGCFEEIEKKLKEEGLVWAKSIIDNCDMSNFNDLIIEFIKRSNSNYPMYHFICHYSDLFDK